MHGCRSRGGILFPFNDRINQVGRLARAAERARVNMEDGRENQNPPNDPPPPMNIPLNMQPPQMENPPRQFTMGQYSRPIIGNEPPAIVLDELTKSYELKTMHISQLPSFLGKLNEDCLQFMKDLSGVVETFPFTSRMGTLSKEQLLMRCFSTCLKDNAKKNGSIPKNPDLLHHGMRCVKHSSTGSFHQTRRESCGCKLRDFKKRWATHFMRHGRDSNPC